MKDILINLLFMIIVLLSTQLLLQWHKLNLNQRSTKIMIFLSSLVLIFICMTFSIPIGNQFNYDLRVIPHIIGSLYGGPIVSIALYLFIIGYRLILGIDMGLLGAMLNYGILTCMLCIYSHMFIQSRLSMKLLMTTLIITIHLLLSRMIYTLILPSGLPMEIFWITSLIKIGIILLFVILAYLIDHYYKLRLHVDHLEKMELVYHLSASISHEVRNGLTSSRGFMQLLNESENDQQKRQYIRIALDELDRTEGIVRDFLTFAKPTVRQNKIIHLEKIIHETLKLVEPLANLHCVEIHKNIIPSMIKGDENMIQQALLNIFKNAIEAMPNGGELMVELGVHKNESMITIKDTGIGMNRDQIHRLGTPYFSTKGQKGTGLGMMVAFRLIKELHGTITVDSQIGKGSIFTIHLPSIAVE